MKRSLSGLLATREDFVSLNTRLGKKPYSTMLDLLRRRCAMILESRPVTEADWCSQHAKGVIGSALTAARTAQGRVSDLAICHAIDANPAFRDRAIEELITLSRWSKWLDPAHSSELICDLCTAECAATMAIGLSLLSGEMNDNQISACTDSMISKAVEPYMQSVNEQAWWYECYHNWNAVINSGCGLAALALADNHTELSDKCFEMAYSGVNNFFNALGSQGGWDEGIGYWGYALRYITLMGIAAERLGRNGQLFKQRGMENTCSFGLYFTPRGHSCSFGDSPAAPLWAALYGLSDKLNSREMCWWLDRWAFHRDVDTSGWSDLGLGLLLRPEKFEHLPKVEPDTLKIYNEIGWAAVADHWCEPEMYVSVKTGDLAAHHSHLDMNTIQIQVDGEVLLCDLGNPPLTHSYHYSSFDRQGIYEVGTQAHNTITVADRSHRIDARGEITDSTNTDSYRWLVANAGDSLGENVRFNRHVIMLCNGNSSASHIAVIDELENARPETVALHWHSYGKITANDSNSGTIVGRQSGLHFKIASDRRFELTAAPHKSGRLTENALRGDVDKCTAVIMATVFARNLVSDIQIMRYGDNQLSVSFDGKTLQFTGGRRHLKLSSVE